MYVTHVKNTFLEFKPPQSRQRSFSSPPEPATHTTRADGEARSSAAPSLTLHITTPLPLGCTLTIQNAPATAERRQNSSGYPIPKQCCIDACEGLEGIQISDQTTTGDVPPPTSQSPCTNSRSSVSSLSHIIPLQSHVALPPLTTTLSGQQSPAAEAATIGADVQAHTSSKLELQPPISTSPPPPPLVQIQPASPGTQACGPSVPRALQPPCALPQPPCLLPQPLWTTSAGHMPGASSVMVMAEPMAGVCGQPWPLVSLYPSGATMVGPMNWAGGWGPATAPPGAAGWGTALSSTNTSLIPGYGQSIESWGRLLATTPANGLCGISPALRTDPSVPTAYAISASSSTLFPHSVFVPCRHNLSGTSPVSPPPSFAPPFIIATEPTNCELPPPPPLQPPQEPAPEPGPELEVAACNLHASPQPSLEGTFDSQQEEQLSVRVPCCGELVKKEEDYCLEQPEHSPCQLVSDIPGNEKEKNEAKLADKNEAEQLPQERGDETVDSSEEQVPTPKRKARADRMDAELDWTPEKHRPKGKSKRGDRKKDMADTESNRTHPKKTATMRVNTRNKSGPRLWPEEVAKTGPVQERRRRKSYAEALHTGQVPIRQDKQPPVSGSPVQTSTTSQSFQPQRPGKASKAPIPIGQHTWDEDANWCTAASRHKGPRHWCHIYLSMQEARFEPVPAIIGRSGKNTGTIAEATGTKIRIRGRGSGHLEYNGREVNAPLMMAVTADVGNKAGFEAALIQAIELLKMVEQRYQAHCLQTLGYHPEKRGFTLGRASADVRFWAQERVQQGLKDNAGGAQALTSL